MRASAHWHVPVRLQPIRIEARGCCNPPLLQFVSLLDHFFCNQNTREIMHACLATQIAEYIFIEGYDFRNVLCRSAAIDAI